MRIVEHNMTEELAVKLLGWKWITTIDVPTKDHPQYPEMMPVRRLMSPKQMADPSWINHFHKCNAQPSDGTEPLSYCHDSSGGWPLPKITILVDD